MKLITLLFALLFASDCDPAAVQQSQGATVITIYCPNGDLYGHLAYINHWLAGENIIIEQIPDSAADVTIQIGGVRSRGARAEAYALSGKINLGSDSTPQDLLHEILHCAGVSHEDDPESIMYIYAARSGQQQRILPHHVEALRRLAGVTPIGRIGRQIEVAR